MKCLCNAVASINYNRCMLRKKAFQSTTSSDNVIIVEGGKICHVRLAHARNQHKKKIMRAKVFVEWKFSLANGRIACFNRARAISKYNYLSECQLGDRFDQLRHFLIINDLLL